MSDNQAPGGPGIPSRWTSSAKDGIGTAYSTSSRVWFTISHGIINEIYFPHVDTPNTRDLEFLITDGETFCHEEKRHLQHECHRTDPNALLYRLINSDPGGRYRIVKEIIGDPHAAVVLISVKVEILDQTLQGKLKLYALLAPHIQDTGGHNSAQTCNLGGHQLLHAHREGVHLVMGCSTGFSRRSVGFVGTSDGWRDLMDNFRMDWQYLRADDGNVAMIGEIDLTNGLEFTLAVSLGFSCQSAATGLVQAFVIPFDDHRANFVEQWKRIEPPTIVSAGDRHASELVHLSQLILLAHEDKTFSGATVASMSIPWGEIEDDSDRGGYHLVWSRDMMRTATALLACGHLELPLRALVWMSCVQADDGGMPQNSEIDGTPYWKGEQLDEVAAPILLAWRLRNLDALRQFDPWACVQRAARFLILNGPVTAQERWEENAGYSPSTLASIIAAIVCAADIADGRNEQSLGDFLREYADWMVQSLELWTVTDRGELVNGMPRHFVRITPESPCPGRADPDPNCANVPIANGGGEHPARNVVDAGFLQLVRLGILAADDPLIVDSVAVVDAVLKHDLPQGPCWRRYNHDGYGQHDDGRAFDGTGVGRCWPLLTGERGHYELAAGRDAALYIKAMEGFAGERGLLAEQLWDAPDIPQRELFFGQPAGSAMPLCWTHAEYIALVRSHSDGKVYDRIEPVYQRYVENKTLNRCEVWTFAHQPARISTGKQLRIICDSPAILHWSSDDWTTSQDTHMQTNSLGLYFADLPVDSLAEDSEVTFTFHWETPDHWEHRNFVVKLTTPEAST